MIMIGESKDSINTKEETVKVMVDNHSNLTYLLYDAIHNPTQKKISINESLFLIAIMEDVQKIEDYLDDLDSTDEKMKYLNDNLHVPVLIKAIVKMEDYLKAHSINMYSIMDALKSVSKSFYVFDEKYFYRELYDLYVKSLNV